MREEQTRLDAKRGGLREYEVSYTTAGWLDSKRVMALNKQDARRRSYMTHIVKVERIA